MKRKLLSTFLDVVSTVLYLKSNADEGQPHMKANTVDGKEDPDRAHRLRIIHGLRDNPGRRARNFPHTTTIQQWYDWETFEGYRALGYQLGQTYILNKPASDSALQGANCAFAELRP